jgi:hypothetical protein
MQNARLRVAEHKIITRKNIFRDANMNNKVESVYANTTLNDVQLGAIYYPILLDLARHKHCLTYGELVKKAKELHPNVEYVQNAIPVSTGKKLEVIRLFTAERGLPNITALIINKSQGECGERFVGDPKQVRDDIFAFDWSGISDEFDMYIEDSEKTATPKKRIKRDTAKKMMSEYYLANKAILPATITQFREEIISILMEGFHVEDAYKMALDG